MILLLSRLCRARSSQSMVRLLGSSSLAVREFSHLPSTTTSPYDDDEHEFFRYTSGRWLWNEKEQLCERYRRFNVPELQLAAANVVGSKMSKIDEGTIIRSSN